MITEEIKVRNKDYKVVEETLCSSQDVFRKKLSDKSVALQKFPLQKDSKNKALKTTYNSSDLDNLIIFKKSNLIERLHFHGSKSKIFEVNLEKLRDFLVNFEKEVVENAAVVYKGQIEFFKKNVNQTAREFMINWEINRESDWKKSLEEKDLIIRSGISELDKRLFENVLLVEEKKKLEERLDDFLDKQLSSVDRNSEERCRKSEVNLDSCEALIIKLESKISRLESNLKVINREKSDWIKFYSFWNEKKNSYEERRKAQEKIFNTINVKNFNLNTEIDSLKFSLSEEKLTSENLRKEISEKDAAFEINEDLILKLKNDQFDIKIKFFSLLAIDSTRNFLPQKIGNYITYAETIIFAAEVNSASNNIVWKLVAVFFVYSLIIGIKSIVRIFCKAFSYFGKLFSKKEMKFEA